MKTVLASLAAAAFCIFTAAPVAAQSQANLPDRVQSDFVDFALEDPVDMENVPRVIRHNFEQMYTRPFVEQWVKRKDMYRASFYLGGQWHEAVYKPNGEWVRTMTRTSRYQMPKAVLAKLDAEQLDDWQPLIFHRVDNQGITDSYAVLFTDNMGEALKVHFSPEGEILKTVRYD